MYETNERLADYVTPTPAGGQENSAPRSEATPSGWRAVLELAKAAAPALAALGKPGAAIGKPRRRVGSVVGRACPVCGRRIFLHLRTACDSRAVPRAPKRFDAPVIRFGDLWDTTRSRRDATSANAGRWAALALLCVLFFLPGCAHSPFYVSGIEARASVTDTSKDGSVYLHISPREGGLAK